MRTVLITGAGRGIGFATARAFADAGCKVLSLDKQFGEDVVGERVDYDLRDISGIPALIGQLGSIDTLVNNAAVLYCDSCNAIPDEHVSEIIALNLRAPVAMIEALAPPMRKRKSGRIVNVGSVFAFTGHPDLWYGVTEAALLSSTKKLCCQTGQEQCVGQCRCARPDTFRDVRPVAAVEKRRGHAQRARRSTVQSLTSRARCCLARH